MTSFVKPTATKRKNTYQKKINLKVESSVICEPTLSLPVNVYLGTC